MKFKFGALLITLMDIAMETFSDHLYSKNRIITYNEDKNSELYAFEMLIMESIDHCIVLCKSKKQCKYINYDHLAKLCYHIGSDSTQFLTGNDDSLKGYIVKKPGFSYGNKNDWDMTGYENCTNCNDYGVCNVNSGGIDAKCLNSGCRQPEKKKNANLRGNIFSIGDKIIYECMEGFIKNTTEPMTSVCLRNGTWSKIEVECFHEAAFDDDAFISGSSFFKFIRGREYDWDAAYEICKKQNMQLVNIKGAEVQNALIKIIKENSFYDFCFWSGGRANIDGVFEWLDGTKVPLGTD